MSKSSIETDIVIQKTWHACCAIHIELHIGPSSLSKGTLQGSWSMHEYSVGLPPSFSCHSIINSDIMSYNWKGIKP